MKFQHAMLAGALALVAAISACGGDGIDESTLSPGARLFRRAKCDSCHGANGEGVPRIGPKLERLSEHWTAEELSSYIRDPAPYRESKPHLKEKSIQFFTHMRAFPELPPDDRATIAAWLLETF